MRHDHLEPEIGEPFGEQTLRGADEEDGLLEVPVTAHEAGFLARVLGVMSRIRLVRHEAAERGRQHREVGVDHDPAVQITEVVVEPGPRLVLDEVEVDVLALRQAEQALGAVTEVVSERVDRGRDLVARHRLRLAPRDQPLTERTASGQDGVDAPGGRRDRVVVDAGRANPVAPLHFVEEADGLAREPLRRHEQPVHLTAHPSPAVGVEITVAGVEIGQ